MARKVWPSYEPLRIIEEEEEECCLFDQHGSGGYIKTHTSR